jgi:hypothetical protein
MEDDLRSLERFSKLVAGPAKQIARRAEHARAGAVTIHIPFGQLWAVM